MNANPSLAEIRASAEFRRVVRIHRLFYVAAILGMVAGAGMWFPLYSVARPFDVWPALLVLAVTTIFLCGCMVRAVNILRPFSKPYIDAAGRNFWARRRRRNDLNTAILVDVITVRERITGDDGRK